MANIIEGVCLSTNTLTVLKCKYLSTDPEQLMDSAEVNLLRQLRYLAQTSQYLFSFSFPSRHKRKHGGKPDRA